DSREMGRDDRGEVYIVEARDREILWHPQPVLAGDVDRTDRDHVVRTHDGARSNLALEQRPHATHATGPVERLEEHHHLALRHAARAARILEALAATAAHGRLGVTVDERDT